MGEPWPTNQAGIREVVAIRSFNARAGQGIRKCPVIAYFITGLGI